MAGLTDRDLQRITRFVETPPRQRTPQLLMPDDDEETDTDPAPDTDVEAAG